MELVKITDSSYYFKSRNNIGLYKNKDEVYLIDSGNNDEVGKKLLKIIKENNWELKGIINTHSNADHNGGNAWLEENTNCEIISSDIENCISKYPILEPSFLYGGFPYSELKNKFLMASPTKKVKTLESLPDGLEYFKLPGHFLDMIGIKTKDNVYYIGDSVFPRETIDKYHIFFIYDVKGYLETLDFLENIEAELFIPTHAEATDDIKELTKLNRDKINEICETITNLLKEKKTFDKLLKELCDKYNITLNDNQNVLVGSSLKSYLSFLKENEKIDRAFEDNYMYWFSL